MINVPYVFNNLKGESAFMEKLNHPSIVSASSQARSSSHIVYLASLTGQVGVALMRIIVMTMVGIVVALY